MKFEGIHIFSLPFETFKQGAAVTIPGIGIFIGKGQEENIDLLRHELGHILQYRKWGFWNFWTRIAPTSLKSARNKHKDIESHMDTWTEWSANQLSYDYFHNPENWNFHQFPLHPAKTNRYKYPNFLAKNE